MIAGHSICCIEFRGYLFFKINGLCFGMAHAYSNHQLFCFILKNENKVVYPLKR